MLCYCGGFSTLLAAAVIKKKQKREAIFCVSFLQVFAYSIYG